ncbi:MAG: transporter, family, multidrug resistance protein [Chloroflexota bacterium]|jgi:DHA1 family multidrug resistance protein-like MFS transporter|nr:transporter, family, multidrug resistance protein [Chloroflexota bacterium]
MPKPSGWRRILTLFTLASFIEVMAYGQLTAFTPLHLPTIGVAPEDVPIAVGLITVGANVLGVLFLPFWGVLADRFGRKPLIIRSFVATGAGLAVAAAGRSVWLFTIGRGLTALNLGNSGLMMTTLHETAPAARLGFAFGVVNGAGPLGAFIGPLLGGPLVDRYGFNLVLGIDAVLLVAVVVALTFGYRDAFVPSRERPPIFASAFEGLRLIWRSPRLRALFPALLVMFAGWMLTFIYLPIVVQRIHGDDGLGTAVGIALGASGLVTLVASPAIGAVADRLGHWRVLYVAAVADGILWLVPWLTRDYWPFVIAFAIVSGIGSGVFSLSFNVLASSTTDAARARVMTFAYLPVNLGFIVGPGLGAFIVSRDVFGIFPAATAFELVGVILLAYAARRRIA